MTKWRPLHSGRRLGALRRLSGEYVRNVMMIAAGLAAVPASAQVAPDSVAPASPRDVARGEVLGEPLGDIVVLLLEPSSSTSPPPFAGSRRRRRRCSVRVLNAEVPSVRHSVIGDLDHDEYDSINPVLLNASARDLQGYVDALLSLVAR